MHEGDVLILDEPAAVLHAWAKYGVFPRFR